MTQVVVFGSVNADLIFAVETLPTPGQTLLASALSVEPGGKGASQAVAAALDGAPTILAGAVGADALSALALPRHFRVDQVAGDRVRRPGKVLGARRDP